MANISGQPLFRFNWSHQAGLHRAVVRFINSILRLIPFNAKYGFGMRVRKSKPPYCLIEGKTAVQVGAPHDTLLAGRSRGMYFSLMAGKNGTVIIVEPDPVSVEYFNSTLVQQKIPNTTVVWSGAWSEPTEIKLHIDRKHPATNFSEGTVGYDEKRLQDFETVRVPADSLDNIVAKLGITKVDLVSITTNWAEIEILEGMKQIIANGLTYICLAYGNPGTDYKALLNGLGFEHFSHDDRGMTFKRKS